MNLLNRNVFLVLSFLFSSVVSLAGNLSTPFENETAGVLPKGIRSPRLKNINTWVEYSFDEDGVSHELAYKLNKQVLFSEMIKGAKSPEERNQLKGTIEANGISENSILGEVTGKVNAYVNANVPIFSIGMNEDWTMALAVPIYNVHVAVQTGFAASDETVRLVTKVGELNPVKAFEAQSKLSNPLANKLNELGYKELKNEDFTALGDTRLVSKYRLLQNDQDTISWKMETTLPTGKTAQQDKLVDFPTGDGQVDIGSGLIWDHYLGYQFTVNTFGFYNYQFADRLDRRIPVASGDPLSADIENVRRKLGDQYHFGSSIQYGSSQGGFYGGLGYTLQGMGNTRYSGDRYTDSDRYRWLEELSPSQELHSMVAQVGYSSIAAYRAKSFAIPLQAHLGYGHPLRGKNASLADVYLAEMVLFF